MITPKTPPGFNEFLPQDQIAFNRLLATIKQAYEQSGFIPLETPALELAEVLLAKEGGDTAKQVYRFTKGDTDLALRFDLTVPLARYVAEHYHDLVFPFRRYQIQEVWRAEKPQAGRFRQFYQADVDIVGSESITAEAEVVLAAAHAYKALGLKYVVFKISHRDLLAGWLAEEGLETYTLPVLRSIDKLDKQSTAEVSKELQKIGLSSQAAKKLLAFVTLQGKSSEVIKKLTSLPINQPIFKAAITRLADLAKLLEASGLKNTEYEFNLKICRGFDYYTGIVFEMFLPDSRSSIGSGGRYDNLVGHYRKETLSGVGASIGVSRLFSVLKNKGLGASTPSQALIAVFNKELLPYCCKVAHELRTHNLRVEIYSSLDKLNKQLTYANKLGIPFVLLCGEDEEKKNKVTIKHMKTGKQETISLSKLSKKLLQILKK